MVRARKRKTRNFLSSNDIADEATVFYLGGGYRRQTDLNPDQLVIKVELNGTVKDWGLNSTTESNLQLFIRINE